MFGPLNNRLDLLISVICLLLIGTIGNILSLVVLCRKKLRQKNIGLYLIALCVSDFFVLHISLFNTFLSEIGIYSDNYEKYHCQLIRFFRVFFLDFSSWITVVITIQRTLAVYRPLSTYLRSNSKCGSPITVLFILFLVIIIMSGAYTNSFTYENFVCIRPHKIVYLLLFPCVYSFIPAIILIVCNVAIVLKIYRRSPVGQTPHSSQNNSQTVRLVLAINIMFLIFTVPPSVLFNDIEFFLDQKQDGIIMVLVIIMNTNNALNFVVYMVVSKSFQDEVKSMCKSKRNAEVWTISNNADPRFIS